jgi:hypothetical protein
MKAIIQETPGHPLTFLLTPDGQKYMGRRHGSEDSPSVQAGHGTSFHSGAPERLFIEDADFNQRSNWNGESKGHIFEKHGVDIGGIPVESTTAYWWEKDGLLPPGTVEHAMPHPGWSPSVQTQEKSHSSSDTQQTIKQIQEEMGYKETTAMPLEDGPEMPNSANMAERRATLRTQNEAARTKTTNSEETQIFMEETRQFEMMNLP